MSLSQSAGSSETEESEEEDEKDEGEDEWFVHRIEYRHLVVRLTAAHLINGTIEFREFMIGAAYHNFLCQLRPPEQLRRR